MREERHDKDFGTSTKKTEGTDLIKTEEACIIKIEGTKMIKITAACRRCFAKAPKELKKKRENIQTISQ